MNDAGSTEYQPGRLEGFPPESLRLLDVLQFNAPVGLAFTDRDFRYVWVNRQFAAISGHPAAEHIGRVVAEVVPDHWSAIEALCRRVLDSAETIVNVQMTRVTETEFGPVRHWATSLYPVQSGDLTIGVGILMTEVTEHSNWANDPLDAPVIRVLIVDDEEILAEGLRWVLDSSSDIKVVGVAGSISGAVTAATQARPDVVLMDYDLPDGDGVTASMQIREQNPAAQVVMLTGSADDEQVARRAFEMGCSGFFGKSQSVEELLAMVRAAYAGKVLIAPSMLMRILPQITLRPQGVGESLSPRELEVLNVMAEGGSDKEIAQRLFVSLNTVRKHAQNIIRKLGAHSKLEAVVIAVREGIIDPL